MVGTAVPAHASTLSPAATATTTTTVEPVYGAGIFNVDPSQAGLSQAPGSIVTGNISSLPLDLDF